ncbi:MAG: hypothetical protein AAGG00_12960 [Cyanobacteria bacterium P01_H01_bin.150]
MTEENRGAEIGRDVKESVIIPGDRNTATITITNYYYCENTTVIPVESTDAADENLPCAYLFTNTRDSNIEMYSNAHKIVK